MATKNVIDEYFISIKVDAKDSLNQIKRSLKQHEQVMSQFNRKLDNMYNSFNNSQARSTQKRHNKEANLRNKELEQMRRYYKEQEKRASRAHNITENLKTQVKWGKLNTAQQEQINRKLKRASDIMRSTGNRDLFDEARRDITVMERQSSVIARNLASAADKRLQARNDLKQGVNTGLQVGAAVSGAGVAYSTKRLVEVGKEQDKLISVFETIYGGTKELSDLQNFITKSGGSLEKTSSALASAIPVMQKQMGDQAIPFFKNLTKVFSANNVGAADQSEAIRQILQAQDGTVTKADLNPIFDRMPLFATFMNDYLKKGYGKTVKEMTKTSALTSDMLNSAFTAFAESKQVSELYNKNQNSMSKKQTDLSNAIYKRWLEVYNDEGSALKDAMTDLTDTINSEAGKLAFKALSNILGGVYDTASDIIRFSGSMLDSSKSLVDTFGELDSTASKAVVGLAALWGGKKALGAGKLLFDAFKPKTMNVAAGVVNVAGVGGSAKANRTARTVGTATAMTAARSLPLLSMAASLGYSVYKTDSNKDAILDQARNGDLGSRAQRALLRADEAWKNNPAYTTHLAQPSVSNKTNTSNVTFNIDARGMDEQELIWRIEEGTLNTMNTVFKGAEGR